MSKTVTKADLKAINDRLQKVELQNINLAIQQIKQILQKMQDDTKRIEDQIKLQSNRLAVEFLNQQVTGRLTQSQFIISALFIANNEYNGILGLKDAQKGIDLDITTIILATIPGVGPIAAGLKKWAEGSSAVKKLLAHIAENATDYVGSVSPPTDADDTSLNTASSANDVIQSALSKAYQQLGLALQVQEYGVPDVIKYNLTIEEVKTAWAKSDLELLDVSEIAKTVQNDANLTVLSKIYLYDMLKSYVGKWVKYTYRYSVGSPPIQNLKENLPEDGNSWGNFTGMTQAARDAIYKRFGTNEAGVSFYSLTQRPMISGYRDMVKHWGLQVSAEVMGVPMGELGGIKKYVRPNG